MFFFASIHVICPMKLTLAWSILHFQKADGYQRFLDHTWLDSCGFYWRKLLSHCGRWHCYAIWLGLLHMSEWVGCPDSCMPGNHLRSFWSPWRRRGSERNAPIVGPGSSHMHSVMVGRFNDLQLIRIPPIDLSSMIMNPLVTQFLMLLTLPQVVIAALKASIMALKSIPQAKKQKERFALTSQSFVGVCGCLWACTFINFVILMCLLDLGVWIACFFCSFRCELLYFCMIFFVCLLFQPMLFLFTNAFLPSGFRRFCPWKFLALLPPARRCGSSLQCGVLYWNHWRKIQSHWDTAQRWG